MLPYKLAGLLVLLGCLALGLGVLFGISPAANVFVYTAFTLFPMAAATFCGAVLVGLWQEFRET